jgi:hypothetical protein
VHDSPYEQVNGLQPSAAVQTEQRSFERLAVNLAVIAPDGEVGNLSRRTRHHGHVPEVDDDQRAALRRLRAAFGPIQIIKVISNHPGDDLAAPQGEPIKGAPMADPRRMTPEEHGEAHALLVTAVSDPDWQAARQALEELLRKLLVVHQLLEAEERLAKREPPTEPL